MAVNNSMDPAGWLAEHLGASEPRCPRCWTGRAACRACSWSSLVRTIFDQPGPDEVHAQHARVVDALEAKHPDAATHLDEARGDLLAFTSSTSAAASNETNRNGMTIVGERFVSIHRDELA